MESRWIVTGVSERVEARKEWLAGIVSAAALLHKRECAKYS